VYTVGRDEREHLRETTMKMRKQTWVATVIAAVRQVVKNLLYG
jgi:hypothetical protein